MGWYKENWDVAMERKQGQMCLGGGDLGFSWRYASGEVCDAGGLSSFSGC
jgi:hypothetical protein